MKVRFKPKFKVLMREINVVAEITQDQYFEYYSSLDKHFAELVESYKAQGKELTGGIFMFEGDDTKWLVGSCAGSKGYSNSKDWIKPTIVEMAKPRFVKPLTLKDLFPVLSPFQDFQIIDSQTANSLTGVDYLADSSCEASTYESDTVCGITPKVDKEGNPYLAILVKLTV